MDNGSNVKDNEKQSSPVGDMAKTSADDMFGHVLAKDYDIACMKAASIALDIGAKTVVNYVPLQNGVLVMGTSKIKKSGILKASPKEIFEDAEGFEFTVVAVGPDVKNIKLGDVVDIKSTHGMSLRPFVPHPLNVTVWRKKLKNDRESLIRHTMGSSEDASKVGSVAGVGSMGIVDMNGEATAPKFDLEGVIEIVEHFATEDHNISSIYDPIAYVREV